jgi:CubicO group peptidase (beta-lactamase class C family)
MRRLLAAFFLPLLAAQEPAPAADTLADRVDRIFAACKPDAPGAVVLVARGDQILLQRAFGLADLERNVPLTVDSVLDIGSTSKQFTAAAVLLLAQQGKLALADAVKKHVPELPACCDAVTLRHLVLHTSGIPDYIGLMAKAGADVEDKTTAADALAALKKIDALVFAPGTKWAYSNSNYFLLSEIVERAGGQPLAEFAQERFFTPLAMASTHIHTDCTQIVKNRALSYSPRRGGGWRWNFSNWEQTGDGSVMTTVGDLLRWARNFETGAVGGKDLLEAMGKPGALDDGTAIDYGMGLRFTTEDGLAVVSHGGAWAGYRAELLRVPSERLVVVCLCNRDDLQPSRLARQVAKAALGK